MEVRRTCIDNRSSKEFQAPWRDAHPCTYCRIFCLTLGRDGYCFITIGNLEVLEICFVLPPWNNVISNDNFWTKETYFVSLWKSFHSNKCSVCTEKQNYWSMFVTAKLPQNALLLWKTFYAVSNGMLFLKGKTSNKNVIKNEKKKEPPPHNLQAICFWKPSMEGGIVDPGITTILKP